MSCLPVFKVGDVVRRRGYEPSTIGVVDTFLRQENGEKWAHVLFDDGSKATVDPSYLEHTTRPAESPSENARPSGKSDKSDTTSSALGGTIMADDKGIYLSISTHIRGETYELFLAMLDREARAWLESDHGQAMVRSAVKKAIDEEIHRHFTWGFDKDPRAEEFKGRVRDAMFKHLLTTLPGVPPTGRMKTLASKEHPCESCGATIEHWCGAAP